MSMGFSLCDSVLSSAFVGPGQKSYENYSMVHLLHALESLCVESLYHPWFIGTSRWISFLSPQTATVVVVTDNPCYLGNSEMPRAPMLFYLAPVESHRCNTWQGVLMNLCKLRFGEKILFWKGEHKWQSSSLKILQSYMQNSFLRFSLANRLF